MSTLFCITEVSFESFGKHMQAHVENIGTLKKPRRLLVDGMKAENVLIATPHLRWYLKHKMKVTQVHEVIEFQSQSCFEALVGTAMRAGWESKQGHTYYRRKFQTHRQLGILKSLSR